MKNIYEILCGAKINTAEYDKTPLTAEESDKIMSRFRSENRRKTIKSSHRVRNSIIGIAAASALIIGTGAFMSSGDKIPVHNNGAAVVSTASSEQKQENSFFLTADAAEAEEQSMVFREDAGGGSIPFSGDLFFVKGSNISTVELSADKCELYRGDIRKINKGSGDNITVTEDGCEAIGSSYTDTNVNEYTCYGLYFDENIYAEHEAEENGNIKKAWHRCYDDVNGAELTVKVTFGDGNSETKKYRLKAGMLVIDKHTMKPTGEFTDDPMTPYVYGVLFERE